MGDLEMFRLVNGTCNINNLPMRLSREWGKGLQFWILGMDWR